MIDDDHRRDDAALKTAREHTAPRQPPAPSAPAAPRERHDEFAAGVWRWRDWVKLGLAATVEQSGIGGLGRTLRTFAAGARVHVLGYHRVVDRIDGDGPINPSLCITEPTFRRQMEQLRERFVILPLSSVVGALAGELELTEDAVAVTFDDGYRDVLLRAAPILKALRIPAAVFVPTGFAAADSPAGHLLPHDRLYAGLWTARRDGVALDRITEDATLAPLWATAAPLLAGEGPAAAVEALIRAATAAELARVIAALEARLGSPALDDGAAVLRPHEVRALADLGWEIGAHTEGHVVLTHEPLPEVRRQLASSKAALQAWSGRPCRYFAYCNGYHSPALVAELQRAGYQGAVTTCDCPNDAGRGDPFRIGRKVLWEAHARGPDGHFSPSLSAANLHDLFGALGLTHPVDGAMEQAGQTTTHDAPSSDDATAAETSNSPPTEVELAY